MRGKRILAWICALCVCMGLTGCATGVNLEGMSDEELKALEAAAREKLEERREANLDAMSDEELEALMAEAQERLKPSLGEMSFDELIALKDEVEKRLGPPPEVVPSEDVLVLTIHEDEEGRIIPYVGGVDIPVGTWYASPMPRGYTYFDTYKLKNEKRVEKKYYMLDSRANGDIPGEAELTIEGDTLLRIVQDAPVVLRRTKGQKNKTVLEETAVITVEMLDTFNEEQLEMLHCTIYTLLYANALKMADAKWTTDKTIRMNKGVWHVGTDVPAGVWTIAPEKYSIILNLLKNSWKPISKGEQLDNFIESYYVDEVTESNQKGKTVLIMPDTWIEFTDAVFISRE